MVKRKIIKSLPYVATLIVLIVALFLVPWTSVAKIFTHIKLWYLGVLLVLSLVYLAAKAGRFIVMLRSLGIELNNTTSALVYLSAQQFTFLPGGELLRTKAMKEYAGVPIRVSSAAIVQQALIEGVSLLLAAIICAVVVGKGVGLLIAATAGFMMILYLSRSRKFLLHPVALKAIDKMPFLESNPEALGEFVDNNRKLISIRVLPILVLISFVPIVAGIAIVYTGGLALSAHLTFLQATTAYILPVAFSYIAVVPGSNEGGMVGVLILLGTTAALAVALTLLTRIFVLGINFIVGPICLILLKRSSRKSG